MTIAEAEKIFNQRLLSLYGEDEARNIAYYSLEHICRVSKKQLLLAKNKNLTPMEETSIGMILDELETGKPVQYCIGETYFYGLRFKVDPSVLIPRPETEELVDWVLTEVKDQNIQTGSLLDIGTGSGCIPVALKKNLPEATVYGLDISSAALEMAIQNAVMNQTEVKFIHADILSNPDLKALVLDVIVSNPPYITTQEKKDMHKNVIDYEPQSALFVEGEDPLLFYRCIANFAKENLAEKGLLFFEINEKFGKETVLLLQEKGFKNVELRQDMTGKDRMIKASL
ncbi:peptide chain release factor N(5)-glutamine methyltransferase [Rubrolithibacter danxiaensis]|uniref:peptide chain release factor N(5)-glutamine methyltransferase n=1 Tax=Rubrolithibacter danxiaensis TaxID=3390805 RepID=UPI003BF902EC